LIQAILGRGAAALPEIVAFSGSDHSKDRINLDPLLVDMVHALNAPEGLAVLLDVIRRSPDEIDEELMGALLPFREQAVEPLLALYEEIGEERGSDVAFLLAGLRIFDPRVKALLEERLEFDAADGAFLLGLYGDPEARESLERMLREIPEEDAELHREFTFALENLNQPQPRYEPEPFDILANYPERELPEFEVLSEAERLEMLGSDQADIRAAAAYSFFNAELDPKARKLLLAMAQGDQDANARARAWEALGDASGDGAIREQMFQVLNDPSKPVEERAGAAVGLYAAADREEVRQAIEKLYEEGGHARVKALEAMWRSLWPAFAKYFPQHLDSRDPVLLHEVLRGVGYFELKGYADKLASFFDREGDLADLREDALFAYALSMPGETTRGRVRGMFRKIDALADLSTGEAELVMFALDERLRLHGLDPVFAAESEIEDVTAPATPAGKVGRNDPCPCGSGKKFKKCHGANATG